MKDLHEKYEKLRRFIEEKGRKGVVIALSGGVDSSTLAAICHDVLGERAVAVTAKSPTYPPEEMDEAQRTAEEIGIKHYIVETDELSNEDFVRNPENRCYYCKKELLDCLQDFAHRLEFKAIFEGTNFSDLGGHRPGFKAIIERENVFSPWAENEFTKEEIRALAQKLRLSVHDKPALACLASRIPFGERITKERLNRIGRAEQLIRKLGGVQQLRVRDHNGLARIEVGKNERSMLFNVGVMDKIAEELKQLGFKFVTMDLEGYKTGSMLVTIETSGNEHNLDK
ncbi:MAG: putative NH(3)-dependent NAD(+) synthetase [Candidatus Bathyarchaeota archaeon BA2]|nr:MAG: putative NH(3)-dependent NAD(+) synthetase [Candidatus Bathyarchaeota archaeon BA2]